MIQLKIIFILIFLTLSSCKIEDKICGTYVANFSPDYAKIIIKKDSIFSYYLSTDLGGDMTYYGKWKLRRKNLIFRIIDPKLSYYYDKDAVVKEYKKDNDYLTFKIFYDNEIPYFPINLVLNKNYENFYTTNENGLIFIKKKTLLNYIEPYGLGLAPFIYKVKNKSSNYFEIYLTTTSRVPFLLRDSIIPTEYKYKLNKIISKGGDIYIKK